MAYALRPVIDTWLKLSTAQGSALPDEQRQLIKAGAVLPISSFELVDNDHIRVTLGKNAQGQQLQFKGRNTWLIYRPAIQLLRDGQVISLPNTSSSSSSSMLLLKPLTDTWLKLSTAQGSALPDEQRQFIQVGELLPLESYAAAANDHLKVKLGKDPQGSPLQFKGHNTWFVYRPAVQILRNGLVVSAPVSSAPVSSAPAPAPQPIPTPMPMPVTSSSYVLKTVIDTWLKTSTAQGSTLPEDQRQFIGSGTVLPISGYELVDNDHLKVTLGKDAQGQQLQFKGRNTWYIYRPSVQVLNNGRVVTIPASTSNDQINEKGLRLLKSFEGLRLQAYQDSVGVWTIGYGTTLGVRPGMVITAAQAEDLLKRDLRKFEQAVIDLVTVPLTSDQFSALVSFTYNVGEGALASSTLLRLLNQKDYQGAADQFLRWDKAGGQALPGLTRRRRAERALFLGQDYTAFL